MISVAITTFAFIGNVQAQNRRWSLQKCIDHAIRHNIEVKQSRNRIEKLKVEKSTLKNSFLPDLSAGTSQKFDFGRSLNRSNAYEDSNTQSSSFSVSAEMPLFTVSGGVHPYFKSHQSGQSRVLPYPFIGRRYQHRLLSFRKQYKSILQATTPK